MNKLLIVVLIMSIIGNVIGLFYAYKYRKLGYTVSGLQDAVIGAGRVVDDLTDRVESGYKHRLLYLHHSVGQGILDQGGLRDSLLSMGIFVKGATYGDEIGQRTDICDWYPKFTTDIQKLFDFKNHPNRYYRDGRTNDIIMFKSCYPCSYIGSEGATPGSPTDREHTMQNYKAAFEELVKEFRKYPEKLFIYMTYPPLVQPETNPEAAKRARQFNEWLINDYLPKYQKETGLRNFAIFDLFDILANGDNVLRDEFRRPDQRDSHPNDQAYKHAAQRFLEFFKPLWNERESGAGISAKSVRTASNS